MAPISKTTRRIVSVSLAPYDGYPLARALDSLAGCGVRSVEPAFIVGYTEPFDESAFTPAASRRYHRALADSGLSCFAVSAHMDLSLDNAVATFSERMHFACAIGASVIATNAAVFGRRDRFFRNVEPLIRHAEDLGMVIGLENPGDGRDNLINTAVDGLALIERIGSPHLRLNYDLANTSSHAPGGPAPAEDAIRAIPGCQHMHLKDVRRSPKGWFFTPIGQGDIDCSALLAALADHPDLAVSIELPLRLHRGPDAQPVRQTSPVPLAVIEDVVKTSLAMTEAGLTTPRPGRSGPG